MNADDLKGARAAYETALRIVEGDDRLREHRGKALAGVADVLNALDRPDHAATMYIEACALEPEPTRLRATILFDLTMALADCGRLSEAEHSSSEAGAIFATSTDRHT